MPTWEPSRNEHRVLILAPVGRDAALTCELLAQAGVVAEPCDDLPHLYRSVRLGAGAAVIAGEALRVDQLSELAAVLQSTPEGSDLPLIVLTGDRADGDLARRLVAKLDLDLNVTLLERPVRPAVLTSTVRSALRARRRQYELRNHLLEHEQTEKALEQAMREAQLRAAEVEEGKRILDSLMEHIPVGIAIADAPDVAVRAVSRHGLALVGRPSGKSQRTAPRDCPERGHVFHADGVTPAAAEELPLYRATQRGELVQEEEWVLVHADGTKVPILCTAGPVVDAQGHVTGGVVAWQDMTQRKRAEATLRQTAERLQLLSDIASQLLASEQPETVIQELCQRVMEHLDCHAFLHFLVDSTQGRLQLSDYRGLPEEMARQLENLGCPVPVCGPLARECMPVAVAELPPSDPRVDLLRAQGIQAFTCQPLTARGHLVGTLAFGSRTKETFTDDEIALMRAVGDQVAVCIERTQLRESLEHQVADRTAELEQRAGQLQAMAMELTRSEERERRRLAQVLHDHLQQLLVTARIRLSLLRRQIRDAKHLAVIHQTDELLNQCIDESRSLSVELSPPVLYNSGLAAGLAWLARHVEKQFGLAVQVEADTAAEPADEETRILLFQCARELLLNTAKHANADRAKIRMTRPNQQQVRIEVADNGVGFDPSTVKRWSAGANGFGLFSIRERLGVLGGSFELDSAPGQGTRVVLLAPLDRPEPAEPTATPPAEHPAPQPVESATAEDSPVARKIRVLLADDHPIFCKGLADLLNEQPGIDLVGEAHDGRQAVEMATHIQPDVVLMDISMPGLNGIQATHEITATLPSVRVIGLSVHAQPALASVMREAGAKDLLSKNEAPEALVRAIAAP